ncbi:MAG: SCO family protein [Phenylobacterium sp.]|uniref:SCO family protein n=1 Tax=Phenylobacterium sp. TaxID=1871053 RepID=UPI003918F278
MRKGLILWAGGVVLAAALALGGVYLASRPSAPTASTIAMPADVRLVDQKGRPFTAADLKGKPSAVFFGFTYCPEICPTTLMDIGRWMEALGPEADKLNVVFVSVDPARDTPEQLDLYLSSFDPRIRGVTGTADAVAAMAKGFRVYYRKVPIEGGEYTMDHSTAVYLMDAKGRFVEPVGYQEPMDRVMVKLRRLLGA